MPVIILSAFKLMYLTHEIEEKEGIKFFSMNKPKTYINSNYFYFALCFSLIIFHDHKLF